MRRCSLLLVLLGLATIPVGCRWTGTRFPIPQSLARSRHLSQRGIAAIERGEWKQADELLSQAVKACSDDHDARYHYAEVLWQRGERERAISQLVEATRLSSDNAALHVRLAQMRHEAGQIPLALQDVQAALDLDPKLAAAWVMRGRILRSQGQLEQALAGLHRGLALEPNDPAIAIEIAELHRQMNEPEKALAALDGAALAYPPEGAPQQLLYLQGLAYAMQGRYDDAAARFSAACLRGQPNAEILYRLAEAELLAGRTASATAAARDALALDPQHGPSRALLGRLRIARTGDVGPPRHLSSVQ